MYGSTMDMEETVENYFGDVVGKGPALVDEEALHNFNERYDNVPVDEFLGLDEEIDQGVVFYDEEEAAYISDVNLRSEGIYMNVEEVNEKSEMLHGLARRFVEYGEPELGDWEDEDLL